MPPKIRATASPVFFAVVVLMLALLGSGAVLFFFDPTRYGFYPICLFHALTGWNCPGCGATRAAYQLLHGHLLRALRDNALFVLLLAGLLIAAVRHVVHRRRNPAVRWQIPTRIWWILLVVALLFTIARNLPAFAWLSP